MCSKLLDNQTELPFLFTLRCGRRFRGLLSGYIRSFNCRSAVYPVGHTQLKYFVFTLTLIVFCGSVFKNPECLKKKMTVIDSNKANTLINNLITIYCAHLSPFSKLLASGCPCVNISFCLLQSGWKAAFFKELWSIFLCLQWNIWLRVCNRCACSD